MTYYIAYANIYNMKSTKNISENKKIQTKENCKIKDNQVDKQKVKELTNEAVKNCVLLGSLMFNLLFLTAWFFAVSDTPSAHALGQLIYNL